MPVRVNKYQKAMNIITKHYQNSSSKMLVFQFKQRLEDARLSDDYLDVCVLFSQLVQIAWRHE